MSEGVLVLAVVIYFVAAGAMSWAKSRSFMFLVWMLLATAITTVLGLVLGVLMLQIFAPETFESQGGGILFLVFLLPVLIGSGLLIGVWSVAWGYWFGAAQHNFFLWQGVGLLGSSAVGTVVPLILGLIFSTIAHGVVPDSADRATPAILGVLVGGFLSPALVHGLIALVVRLFFSR